MRMTDINSIAINAATLGSTYPRDIFMKRVGMNESSLEDKDVAIPLNTGVYPVSNPGKYTDMLIAFNMRSGSISQLQLLQHYEPSSRLKIRRVLDNDRFVQWKEIPFMDDLSDFVTKSDLEGILNEKQMAALETKIADRISDQLQNADIQQTEMGG